MEKRQINPPEKKSTDRLPPHSQEAEQGVLGCIMISPGDCLPECIAQFKGGVEVFYDLRNKTIFETMLELMEDGSAIDIITLQERLSCWGKLDQIGGITYLSKLADCVPSSANLPSYTEIVREKWIMRRMIQACTGAVTSIFDYEGDLDQLMDQVEKDLLAVSQSRIKTSQIDIESLVHDALHEMELSAQQHGAISGIETGFIDYDKLTDGLHAGEMIVIAARPSVGKSSLMMNIVEHVAVTNHLPVGVFSLEMTGKELVKRMISSRARVNTRNIKDGFISQQEMTKLTHAAGSILQAPIHIDDEGGQSVIQIRAKARRLVQQHQIKLVCLDYLQLSNAMGGKRKFESRQQEVSDISSGCKNMAKELGVPVVVLSQLNRDIEHEKNRKPRLSDLRESGSIEQDADVVGFLYRTKLNGQPEADEPAQEVNTERINWLVAKQRNGPSYVDVPLTFLRSITRFENSSFVNDYNQPQQQSALPYANE